jgi:DNA-binding Lrp family transcriptional regulator
MLLNEGLSLGVRKDARMKLTEMSKLTRVPVSTLFDRINSMDGGLLVKNTAILRFEALGFSVKAMVAFAVNVKDREALSGILRSHPNVNSLYRINNGWDFLVEGVFVCVKDVEEFVEGVEAKVKIKNRRVHFVIEDLVRENMLSSPEAIILRGERE